MKIFLGADHAGFEVKEKVKKMLINEGYKVEDCGAYKFDKTDDYPDFISKAAKNVSEDPENNFAIVFGGSGQAEAMLANKYVGVRAALFYSQALPVREADITGRKSEDPFEMLRLTKEHNNANVLSIGTRFLTEDRVLKVVKFWLETPFTKEERHMRRIDKIKKLEERNFV